MKGKKNQYFYLLGIPALAVIFFSLLTGIADPEPDRIVQSLVKDRIRILANVSSGNLHSEVAEHRLRQIERDAVLNEDLSNMSKTSGHVRSEQDERENHFCFITFKELKRKKTMFEYITYEARIQWDSGDSVWTGIYNIAIQKDAEKFFLTVFEPSGRSFAENSANMFKSQKRLV